eukprot:5911061-Amphidinium_carterae.1
MTSKQSMNPACRGIAKTQSTHQSQEERVTSALSTKPQQLINPVGFPELLRISVSATRSHTHHRSGSGMSGTSSHCLLYTSDAADDTPC